MVMAKGTPFEFQIDQQEIDKMEKLKVGVFTNRVRFGSMIMLLFYNLGIKCETPLLSLWVTVQKPKKKD